MGLKFNIRYWVRFFVMVFDGQLFQFIEIIFFVIKKDVSEYIGVFDVIQDIILLFIIVEDFVSGRMIIEIIYRYVNEFLDLKFVLIDFIKRISLFIFQFVIKIRYDVLKVLVKFNKDCIVILDGVILQFNFVVIDSSDIDKLIVFGVLFLSIYIELIFIRVFDKYNVKDVIFEVYDIRYIVLNLIKQVGILYFLMLIKILFVNRELWLVVILYVFDLIFFFWKELENVEFVSDNKSVIFNL